MQETMSFESLAGGLSAGFGDHLAVSHQGAASSMDATALTYALTVCCFRDDCPSKDLESAIFGEVIVRLQHPFTWRFRRWWRSIAKAL
ncbi:MAG: hypothetical protein ABSA83_20930 [Verrucomicrobiota bacterium]|jgi:hypothetical protein